ncbi:MAG: hypothetical protein KC609_24260 [Myxococcales bacterium]|nr:hypothetical protein [Myxococcales bacterium]
MSAPLEISHVDWSLFALPVEFCDERVLPEHLQATVRTHSLGQRTRKREFWRALTVFRSGALESLKKPRRLRQRAGQIAFSADGLACCRDHTEFFHPLTIRSPIEAFLELVLEIRVDDFVSFAIEPAEWTKFPDWLDSRLEDIEPQFFLRNIARYEYDKDLDIVEFKRESIDNREWVRALDEMRTIHYEPPELLAEWSSYLLTEYFFMARQAIFGHDWDETFGYADLKSLESRRRCGNDRMFRPTDKAWQSTHY